MANSSEGKVVALYTSAWIEITCSRKPFSEYTVALYTSAWIEINLFDPKDQIITVALYTSAWIEMKRPSFQEMVAYVQDVPEVFEALRRERLGEASDDFGDLMDPTEEGSIKTGWLSFSKSGDAEVNTYLLAKISIHALV